MALVGLVAVALGSQLREGTATGGPGARFLPVLLGLIVAVLGVGIALRPGVSEGGAGASAPGGAGRVAWTLGAIVAYVLALGHLGFLLASAPFLAVLFVAYGERRWPVERSNAWILENKCLALRYDRLGFIIQSLLQATCIFLVARRVANDL